MSQGCCQLGRTRGCFLGRNLSEVGRVGDPEGGSLAGSLHLSTGSGKPGKPFEFIFCYCCFVFQFHELVTTHLLFEIIMVLASASESNECMVSGPLGGLIALMPASESIFSALRYTHSILLKVFV